MFPGLGPDLVVDLRFTSVLEVDLVLLEDLVGKIGARLESITLRDDESVVAVEENVLELCCKLSVLAL